MSFDSEGERVCLLGEVKGPHMQPIHNNRRIYVSQGSGQDDTIRDLEKVLAGDCICILGDLNEQLEGDVQGHTGKWVAGPKSPKSDKILNLMRMHKCIDCSEHAVRTKARHVVRQMAVPALMRRRANPRDECFRLLRYQHYLPITVDP